MAETFIEVFGLMPDPRQEQGKRHLLIDIIVLSVMAIICGAEGWEEIEEFGHAKQKTLLKLLLLPHGIPSHDTLERVFRMLDSEKLEELFFRWTSGLQQASGGQLIHIDGKTLCGSQDEKNGKYALHLVSAWCSQNAIVLGQLKTDVKANEINTIKKILDILELKEKIITIDAMGCQKDIASQIVTGKGEYILAVKGNQEELQEEVVHLFSFLPPSDTFEQIEKEHGRIETRKYTVLDAGKWLAHLEWPNLETVIKAESKIEKGDDIAIESRYYISSKKASAKLLGHAIRTHWQIENKLHWVLDVQMDEDKSRKRKNRAAENIAVMRRITLNLIQQNRKGRRGVKALRRMAGWDDSYLKQILLTRKCV